ncbi:RecQ family ATP-dependent DNA helicase [Shewanella nanhaiensis]|uniref:DNA 3'-5' helicase n=1 Tax=Shewanella nanhaiensis TaxID=2864872 RepID=A0ABS7E677_9GAMM|nr:RecQ family ATP-dependent DNA helicase [Shewanella nanhaiensis]MBW8184651.1 RecQ family ATP-dependent DNA helicase [Shewanella nanhaiensis]
MQQLLQSHFGFSEFRPGQEQVVRAILDGHSAAAIFPTGSGKSLCYQLPALCLPHLTIVVSPLLALIQDQISFLNSKGIAAASIDSTQSREETNEVMAGVRAGVIKILMISVERLNNERFRQFIAGVPISLLVVDEAHCISEWGHNFRPDYLKLPSYQQALNIPQTLLLTATATSKVIQDMGSKFGIKPEHITLTGFYRPNLHLGVKGLSSTDKLDYLSTWLQTRLASSGIIYVTLQQTAEKVAEQLKARGISAKAYHAGMTSEVRQAIQHKFMSGEQGIIVATIAFGMGIDKSDIRFVVHYDLPKSIENYAQEIGRAGRDGGDSECLVLANGDNLSTLENFVYGDTPEPVGIEMVLNEIKKAAFESRSSQLPQWELVLNSLSNQSNIRPLSLKTLLVYLELLNVIKPTYSYFAEYKFKFLLPEAEVIEYFTAERRDFIRAIFTTADRAKIWSSVNFDSLNQSYASDRQRVLKAINYLDEKGMIELQSKQMTQVYQVVNSEFDDKELTARLSKRFLNKEASEVARINHLVELFTSPNCLSRQLAHYFSDDQMTQDCGVCSACRGEQAILPPPPYLTPLEEYDFNQVCVDVVTKLGTASTPVLVARFLCGLTTPLFTKLKLRSAKGFAQFERYRFSDVKLWVTQGLK